MKKMLALVLVLAVCSIVNAAPTMKLGDTSGAFGAGNTKITTSAAGDTVDLYIWASSDLVLQFDQDTGDPIGTTGLDIAQVFLQFDKNLIGLNTGTVGSLTGVSGNPFGTTWSGRTTGDWGTMQYIGGALVPSGNVDAFGTSGMIKIMKASFKIVSLSDLTTVSLTPSGDATHQSFLGNSIADLYFADAQSVTFTVVPEPITMALLGLGGLFLRKRK